MTATDTVLVVGAGMAGLTAARRLVDAGMAVTVVDKGRAPGGRMATRTVDGARFDHGAQHFSARDPGFAAAVETWSRAGAARVWYHGESLTEPGRGTEPRHVGVGGMRRLPEHLAEGLDVRSGVRLTAVATDGDGVAALVDDGTALAADAVVLTPPIPQTLDLLDAGGTGLSATHRRDLESVPYEACLAVMATLDGPSGLPDGHRAPDGEPVAWLADNQHKGTSTRPAVTIHSTPAFAASAGEGDPAGWTAELVAAARPHLGATVVAAVGHRWAFSRPTATLDVGALVTAEDPLVIVAGEALAGARVEGAFLSGVAAAAAVLDRV